MWTTGMVKMVGTYKLFFKYA